MQHSSCHGSGWAVIRVLKDRTQPREYRLDDRGRLIERPPRNARRRLSRTHPDIAELQEFPQLQAGPVPAAISPSLAHIGVLRSPIVFPASILQTADQRRDRSIRRTFWVCQ